MNAFLTELRRRNVFRVAAAYLVVGWLLIQVTTLIEAPLNLPGWTDTLVIVLLALGLPVALLLAWAFEMTPEGMRPTAAVPEGESIAPQTGRRIDFAILGGLALVAALVVGSQFMPSRQAPTAAAPATVPLDARSVAVIPFAAFSTAEEDRFFADGLTEEILNSLAALPDLLVTSRTSAFQFRGDDLPSIGEIAAQLGVAHVVEGSVRRSGNQVRVTVQLIRASDDVHLWSGTYDRVLDDVFGIQEDIAENIAALMGVALDDRLRERLRQSGSGNVEAFIAYQRGYEIMARHHFIDASRMIEAEPYFERATELDPTLSQAYLLQGDYYAHAMVELLVEPGTFQAAEYAALAAEAERLIAAANANADDPDRLLLARGEQIFFSDDWTDAAEVTDQIFDQARCLDSNWATNLALLASRFDDFIDNDLRHLRCDPLAHQTRLLTASIMMHAGRAEEAVAHVEFLEANNYVNAFLRPSLDLALGRRTSEADLAAWREDDPVSARLFEISQASYFDDGETANRLAAEALADPDLPLGTRLIVNALIGNREGANAAAALIDARPTRGLPLMLAVVGCKCGAPFDIEATPNFQAQMEAAGFPWPPLYGLEFALKDG